MGLVMAWIESGGSEELGKALCSCHTLDQPTESQKKSATSLQLRELGQDRHHDLLHFPYLGHEVYTVFTLLGSPESLTVFSSLTCDCILRTVLRNRKGR